MPLSSYKDGDHKGQHKTRKHVIGLCFMQVSQRYDWNVDFSDKKCLLLRQRPQWRTPKEISKNVCLAILVWIGQILILWRFGWKHYNLSLHGELHVCLCACVSQPIRQQAVVDYCLPDGSSWNSLEGLFVWLCRLDWHIIHCKCPGWRETLGCLWRSGSSALKCASEGL